MNKYSVKNNRGFSLIEMAVVLTIAGILLAAVLFGLKVWLAAYENEKAQILTENASKAISNFYAVTGRLPCAANPALDVGNAAYGQEDCSAARRIVGERDVDGDGANDPVYLGSLPTYVEEAKGSGEWTTLQSYISGYSPLGTELVDPWQNDLVYAVTESLADSATYNASNGVIAVVDEFGRNTGGTENNAHYVVFSRGRESDCGALILPGQPGGPPVGGATPPELENCDGDSKFSVALANFANGNDYYDDLMEYKVSSDAGIWQRISTTSDIRNRNTGVVMIGSPNPATLNTTLITNLKLDVNGVIQTAWNVRANRFCNPDGKCMDPATLFSKVQCTGTGQYITSINLNNDGEFSVTCDGVKFNNRGNGMCPPGKFLNGIFTNGQLDCVNPPPPETPQVMPNVNTNVQVEGASDD